MGRFNTSIRCKKITCPDHAATSHPFCSRENISVDAKGRCEQGRAKRGRPKKKVK